MTNEEAREALSVLKIYDAQWLREAVDMAIEALSANETPTLNEKHQLSDETPTTDLISRADAIEAIESRQTEQWIDADVDYNNGLESAVAEIKALPSANAEKPCKTCGYYNLECPKNCEYGRSSADRPTGKWVESLERNNMMNWFSYGGYCTNCGEYSEYLTRYCGDCGAVMYALNEQDEVIGGGNNCP